MAALFPDENAMMTTTFIDLCHSWFCQVQNSHRMVLFRIYFNLVRNSKSLNIVNFFHLGVKKNLEATFDHLRTGEKTWQKAAKDAFCAQSKMMLGMIFLRLVHSEFLRVRSFFSRTNWLATDSIIPASLFFSKKWWISSWKKFTFLLVGGEQSKKNNGISLVMTK